jgi:hypothetical protein
MAYTGNGPSASSFFPFVCEQATVIDVNKRNFTVSVVTETTSKRFDDLQLLSPYVHNYNGEGFSLLPEVGAVCMVGRANDTSPPFIMGFIMVPNIIHSDDGTPLRSTSSGGSSSDVSFQGNRPDLQPGDMFWMGRDENFIILRRGGVLQMGATEIAQRICLPIGNYIKDFCENYSLDTFAGDIRMTVERAENDPSGDAPSTYVFHLNEYAQDERASLRVRHFPLRGPDGGAKVVWEVKVAKNGIDRDTGAVSDETYSLMVEMSGKKTEFIGADYQMRVDGNYLLEVGGDVELKASGKGLLSGSQEVAIRSSSKAVVDAPSCLIGGPDASMPAVLGTPLVTYLTTLATAAGAAPPPPSILSTKVKLSS